MIIALWCLGLLFFASFLLIVFRGAPYVPTHRRSIDEIFSLHDFKPGEVLVDLGSGDGRVLKAAAGRSVQAIGYELNPFLALYSRWRLRAHRKHAQVLMGDFWRQPLPADTAVVFVFLAGPFMAKLERKLQHEATRLNRELVLMSYGMKLGGREPDREHDGFMVYRIQP